MVFAATNNPNDTSNQTVKNLAFYPDINIADFKKAYRVSDTITDQRTIEAIKNALINVNDQLANWQADQALAGISSLSNVPSDNYGNITKHQQCYYTAVYATAKSYLIDEYRDTDTTNSGNAKTQDMDESADIYLAMAKSSIRKLLGIAKSTIELI